MSIRFTEVYQTSQEFAASDRPCVTLHCHISDADLLSTDLVTSLTVVKSAMSELKMTCTHQNTKLKHICFWSDQSFCSSKNMKGGAMLCATFFKKWQAIASEMDISCWWNFKCNCTNYNFSSNVNVIENYQNIIAHIEFNNTDITERGVPSSSELQLTLMLGKQDIALSQALIQLNKHRRRYNNNNNYSNLNLK